MDTQIIHERTDLQIVGLAYSVMYFGERMETNSVSEKVKKERNDKILFKNYV